MNEFDIIARFFKPLSDQKHGLGLVDDAALIKPDAGHEFVMTTDALVENVHFIGIDNPSSIANKAIGVNVSDIIAKGAIPKYYLLTLSYQPSPAINEQWFTQFSETLAQKQALYGCLLIGGDSVRTAGPLMVSITMIGQVPIGKMVKRSTAQAGDSIYVSGTIGDSVIGLALKQKDKQKDKDKDKDEASLGLSNEQTHYFLNRYDNPEPNPPLAALVQDYASASMDVSDGLLGDLEKLCRASGKGAGVQLSQIPLQTCLQKQAFDNPDLLARLITGGDDYEVLMSVSTAQTKAFEQAAQQAAVQITNIGIITDSRDGFSYYDEQGNMVEFSQKSYQHF